MISPIFIFSLPRSGSTLLQRILKSHEDIASVSEPWFMLPFVYALKEEGTVSEYGHKLSFTASEDFVNNLPNKKQDYFDALGDFASVMYEKQCQHNEKYFLDKTPRYYNIITEIEKIFPNAKFIFLFRNPVHVMSSMIETWGNGELWKMFAYDRDLNYGPKALSEGYVKLKNKSYALRYEDLVQNPEKYVKEVCRYLNIDFNSKMLDNLSTSNMQGRLGDPTGIKEYTKISNKSLEKWKLTFNTPFRKKLIYKYITTIDDNILNISGYDKEKILNEIGLLEITSIRFTKDIIYYLYSRIIILLKINIFFDKRITKWSRGKYLS